MNNQIVVLTSVALFPYSGFFWLTLRQALCSAPFNFIFSYQLLLWIYAH